MHWKLHDLWTGFSRISILAAISFVLATGLFVTSGHPFKTTTPNMSVVHILLVSFKPSAPKDTVDSVGHKRKPSAASTHESISDLQAHYCLQRDMS
jgi:hypothetical protein